MAAAPTANDIKAQLVSLLTTPIATGKKAKILDYLPLAYLIPEGEDPTVLKSDADPVALESGRTDRRVNCVLISEQGFTQAPAQRDGTRHETQPRGRNLVSRRFYFAYVYQLGLDSEDTFSTNLEVMRTTINDNPKLGFETVTNSLAGQGAYILDHGGLQMPTMLPQPFSGIICHLAEGLLEVRVIDPLGSL